MRNAWLRLDLNRRIGLIAIVGGLLALAVIVARRASEPDYVVLFHDLDLAGVSGITDRLTKATISYKLDQGGGTIEVPIDQAAKARVLLAKDGLPSTGRPGMELFDKPQWGMTDFTQRVTYQRALEGELARAIGTLQGVQHAEVHLALPDDSPLASQQQSAEAAVVVSMQPNVQLTDEQVQGITQLVSGSVEQLTPEHVTVLDDTGRPLTGASSENGGLTAHQLDLQQKVEQHLSNKIQQLLASAIPAADLRVQVAAQLNFDQVERSIDTYDPNGKVLQNEQRSQTSGATGADSAAGESVINNTYLNSRKLEKIVAGTGNITRLTVAVMINQRALKSDDQRNSLSQLVRTAVGIDSTRGDQLTLLAIPFTDSPTTRTIKTDSSSVVKTPMTEKIRPFIFPIISLLALGIAFLIGWRALQAPPALLPPGAPEPGAVPAGAAPDAAVPNARNSGQLGASPDAAARVIRAWLAESP